MSQPLVTNDSVKTDPYFLDNSDFDRLVTPEQLHQFLKEIGRDFAKIEDNLDYEKQLKNLQLELVKLQAWIVKEGKRVVVIFEGRDAAGKGGAIKRFSEHLNPRAMRTVALSKPSEIEKKQWYFRRYITVLPNAGELVFFDRSWYNRAVVEPVMGFCNDDQYQQFMRQVSEFEHMLFEDGINLIKFWFSISKKEQEKRFAERNANPLKQWKLSPVDEQGQLRWEKYTYYKEQMLSKTHTSFSPWTIVKTNSKKEARLESIRYLLSCFEYEGKEESSISILPDPNVIMRFHRSLYQNDSNANL